MAIKQEDRNSVESSKIWNLEQSKKQVYDFAGTSSSPIFDYSLINKLDNGSSFTARFSDNSYAEVRVVDGDFKIVSLN